MKESNYLLVESSYSIQVLVESLTENCLVLECEPFFLLITSHVGMLCTLLTQVMFSCGQIDGFLIFCNSLWSTLKNTLCWGFQIETHESLWADQGIHHWVLGNVYFGHNTYRIRLWSCIIPVAVTCVHMSAVCFLSWLIIYFIVIAFPWRNCLRYSEGGARSENYTSQILQSCWGSWEW